MVYQGNIAPVQVSEELNNVHYDVKRALKASQDEINTMISDLGDPTKKTLTINGQQIDKLNTTQLSLAVNNRMDQLSTQSTTILSVFSQLFQLEKTLSGA